MKMSIKNTFISFLLLIGLVLSACDSSPVFPIEPKVEFIDIQPRTVRHFQDSIVVTIKFQDGDGNVGALIDGDINLQLIDERYKLGILTLEQATNGYSLPNLTPDARNPSIQGEISVTIPLTVNTGVNMEEEVRYQIKLWDRAGNLAGPIDGNPDNAVYTDFITVYR
ncbi:MAG: hypothetical protein KDD99_16070 [Bacteroidetes bacterium]|nr:hypothetical protein [Bacteroidota bacterium]